MSAAPSAGTHAGSYLPVSAADAAGEADRLRRMAAELWTRERAALRALGLRPGLRFLDLGCGPGAVLRQILADDPPSLALGIDRDARLVAHARAATGAAIWRADGACLPLRDGVLDAVFMRFVLRHVPDPERVVAEAVRVLRPGGLVLAVEADEGGLILDPEPPGWPALRAALEVSTRRRGGDPQRGRRLRALLAGAGLEAPRTLALAVTSDEIGAAAFVEHFLAPDARPVDADLLAPAAAARAWADLRAWARRPDAFACTLGILCAGQRPA
ncbi:MAG TPA: methyltransferase domain-containing protein [Myxococcota bacterium]|jgi:SAM-dependent methyltransferase|nr:methyltransferase domain-containing protein [Myxococcota bacterium]